MEGDKNLLRPIILFIKVLCRYASARIENNELSRVQNYRSYSDCDQCRIFDQCKPVSLICLFDT